MRFVLSKLKTEILLDETAASQEFCGFFIYCIYFAYTYYRWKTIEKYNKK